MLKLLIGPLVVGAGYAAGSYYGADAEQLVHKSPEATYAALDQAFSAMRTSGTTSFEGGTPMPYEIRIDRTPGEKLALTLLFAGRQAAEADMILVAENGGTATLIKANIHGDRAILRTALAGTDRARLAYAPDWMLNLTVKPLLKQLATQIEQGQIARVDALSEADAEAEWEANLSDQERGDLATWRQYQATEPAVDPDAAAQNYMNSKTD